MTPSVRSVDAMYSQRKSWLEPAVAFMYTNYASVRRLLRAIERCMGYVTYIGAAWSNTVPITRFLVVSYVQGTTRNFR
jgi:hypothetical protein